MDILVTGGSGFIGTAFCRHAVLAQGHRVLNLDLLTYAANRLPPHELVHNRNYFFLQGDIGDRQKLRAALDKFKPNAVVHLAAESHVDRSIATAAPFITTNILGTHCLLEEVHYYFQQGSKELQERFRFLHVSTDEVYGSAPAGSFFTEQCPYDPSAPYSASKAASDHLASAWHRTFGLPVIISNCSNNFGPYQYPEKLIPVTILGALKGTAINVYGQGANIRDWIHVADHVQALFALLEHGVIGRKYNIGAGNERTNLELVRQICRILDDLTPKTSGHHDLIEFVEDRPGHDMRYAINACRIKEDTGWTPSIPLDEGLETTVRWYLENTAWWEPISATSQQKPSGRRESVARQSG